MQGPRSYDSHVLNIMLFREEREGGGGSGGLWLSLMGCVCVCVESGQKVARLTDEMET